MVALTAGARLALAAAAAVCALALSVLAAGLHSERARRAAEATQELGDALEKELNDARAASEALRSASEGALHARARAGAATAAARTASESAAAAHASARRLQEEHMELERAATEAARELEEADPFTTKPQLRAELDTPEARAQVRARTYI